MKRTDIFAGRDYAQARHNDYLTASWSAPVRVRVVTTEPRLLKGDGSYGTPENWQMTEARKCVLVRLVREDGSPTGPEFLVSSRELRGEWDAVSAERAKVLAAEKEVRDLREREARESARLRAEAADAAARHGVKLTRQHLSRTAVRIEAADLMSVLAALPEGWKMPESGS